MDERDVIEQVGETADQLCARLGHPPGELVFDAAILTTCACGQVTYEYGATL